MIDVPLIVLIIAGVLAAIDLLRGGEIQHLRTAVVLIVIALVIEKIIEG